ncbi:MAG: MFS transporter [Candidatus Bipolaricaulota bacterium]
MLAVQQKVRSFVGRYHRSVWALVIIRLVTASGVSMSLPFLALYLHQQRGLPMTVVGTIMMVSALLSPVGRLVGGDLADRIGRRPVLMWAVSSRASLFLALAALIWQDAAVWAIALCYSAVRLSGAFAMPCISALIADLTPPEQRTEAYGLMRVGSNVGWAAGPAIGGYLAVVLPYATLFAFSAFASALSLALVFALAREPVRLATEQQGLAGLLATLRDRRFTAFVGLSILVLVVSGQLVSTLSVFTVDRLGLSEARFGGLLTLNGALVVALQYPLARVASRLARYRALVLGSVLYGLGYLSLGWLHGYAALLGAITVVTLGEMIFQPTALGVTAAMAPPGRRGTYMGAFGLAEAVGWSAGPFLGGVLLDAFPGSPALMWGTITSLAFTAAVGFLLWTRDTRG